LQEITDAPSAPARERRAVRKLAFLAVLLLAGCGGASSRPDLQRTLDDLVRTHVAPGVTAYVAGPKGEWSGAAGYANVAENIRMRADDRLRLESVSKLWTATVVLKLVEEGQLGLDDRVEQWLPRTFPYGGRITVRQLLNHTSGIVDNNDLYNDPEYWFAQIHDSALQAAILAHDAKHPNTPLTEELEIRVAAALPLQVDPGRGFRYSNIGYKVAGRIAERASGESLDSLYHRVIIVPLQLGSARYSPGPQIHGPHPVGYVVRADGTAIPATNAGAQSLGAEGGIVASARDEATFLRALMQGRVVSKRMVSELKRGDSYGLGTGISGACTGTVYTHNGGGSSWASSVVVSGDGRQVAVLLLNGRTQDNAKDADYAAAVFKLFCDA
jgi:D-alanyl-D-alanine carboxypeptidase